MRPIFLFSLPRSGSTLVQRMLATSDEIATVSEPWILLPYLYTLKDRGVFSEYWHSLMFEAVGDFYKSFPNKRADYVGEIRKFTLNLYALHAGPEVAYFLDKTPRYHLICNEILETFPNAKFIFLWRNPLSVISSIINSWTGGKWKLAFHKIDIYRGLENLVKVYEQNQRTVHALQYEKLLINPSHELKEICNFIGIAYSDKMINAFGDVQLDGHFGDRLGTKKYRQLSTASIDAWKKTFNNIYRRIWARRYLKWVGDHRLKMMGYHGEDLKEALSESKQMRCSAAIVDMLRAVYYNLFAALWPILFKIKNRSNIVHN